MHNRFFAVLARFVSLILAPGCHQNKAPDIQPGNTNVPPSATLLPATSPLVTSTSKREPTAIPLPPNKSSTSEPSPTQPLPLFQIKKEISYILERNNKQKLDLYLPTGIRISFHTIVMIQKGSNP
jgi:hypothetical protein